ASSPSCANDSSFGRRGAHEKSSLELCQASRILWAMQLVRDLYAAKISAGRPAVSFEFFPPKTEEGEHNLLERTIPALLETKPDYCSVTYGAGGSTREKTLRIVDRIQRQHGLTAVAHLTCVDSTREQIQELLGQI